MEVTAKIKYTELGREIRTTHLQFSDYMKITRLGAGVREGRGVVHAEDNGHVSLLGLSFVLAV